MSKLPLISEILIDVLSKWSHSFHTISCISHKSRRRWSPLPPQRFWREVRPTTKKRNYSTLFVFYSAYNQFCYSTGLSEPFNDSGNTTHLIDQSLWTDLNCIRLEFETRRVRRIYKIPGSVNLFDPFTKPDIPLTQALSLIQHTRRLTINFPKSESSSYDRPFGQGS